MCGPVSYPGSHDHRTRNRRSGINGTVKKLVSDRGFGFISASDGKEYFFHRNVLETSADFDRLIGGERVESEHEVSPKGLQGGKVKIL
jgi:cold shock CspA family protein